MQLSELNAASELDWHSRVHGAADCAAALTTRPRWGGFLRRQTAAPVDAIDAADEPRDLFMAQPLDPADSCVRQAHVVRAQLRPPRLEETPQLPET